MIAAGLFAVAMTASGGTGFASGAAGVRDVPAAPRPAAGGANAGADPAAETLAVAERRIRAAHLISLRAVARVRMARFRTGAELVRAGRTPPEIPPEGDRPLNWLMEDHVNREDPVGELLGLIRANALLSQADGRSLGDLVRRNIPQESGRRTAAEVLPESGPCGEGALAAMVECAETWALAAVRAAQAAELDADRAIGLPPAARRRAS